MIVFTGRWTSGDLDNLTMPNRYRFGDFDIAFRLRWVRINVEPKINLVAKIDEVYKFHVDSMYHFSLGNASSCWASESHTSTLTQASEAPNFVTASSPARARDRDRCSWGANLTQHVPTLSEIFRKFISCWSSAIEKFIPISHMSYMVMRTIFISICDQK